jgi:transketolase
MRDAVAAAKAVTDKPSIIKVRTTIGIFSAKEGTAATHGAPLGAEECKKVKSVMGLNPEQNFQVSADVKSFYNQAGSEGDKKAMAWKGLFENYTQNFSAESAEIKRRFAGRWRLLPLSLL